jgi:hypothetical protein
MVDRYIACDTNSGVVDVSLCWKQFARTGFQPPDVEPSGFDATAAIPGTREKLAVLAARASAGLPLWHDHDRADYEEPEV